MHSSGDRPNAASQTRAELLNEARYLIIRARHQGINGSGDLLVVQHGIERALGSERRARRNRRSTGGTSVTEVEESPVPGASSVDLDAEDATMTDGSVEEPQIEIASIPVDENSTGGTTDTDNSGRIVDLIVDAIWQIEDWERALETLGLGPSTLRWPSIEDAAILVPASDVSFDEILTRIREGAPESQEHLRT